MKKNQGHLFYPNIQQVSIMDTVLTHLKLEEDVTQAYLRWSKSGTTVKITMTRKRNEYTIYLLDEEGRDGQPGANEVVFRCGSYHPKYKEPIANRTAQTTKAYPRTANSTRDTHVNEPVKGKPGADKERSLETQEDEGWTLVEDTNSDTEPTKHRTDTWKYLLGYSCCITALLISKVTLHITREPASGEPGIESTGSWKYGIEYVNEKAITSTKSLDETNKRLQKSPRQQMVAGIQSTTEKDDSNKQEKTFDRHTTELQYICEHLKQITKDATHRWITENKTGDNGSEESVTNWKVSQICQGLNQEREDRNTDKNPR